MRAGAGAAHCNLELPVEVWRCPQLPNMMAKNGEDDDEEEGEEEEEEEEGQLT